MRRELVFWGGAYVLYLSLWVLANYPALVHPWWYRDDFIYGQMFTAMSPLRGLVFLNAVYLFDGRPFAFLAEWPFMMNHFPNGGFNMTVHTLQGAGHAGLALAIAFTLCRWLARWQTLAAVSPFLLWGLNGGAVLYSSAYYYVLAAAISLAGLQLILYGSGKGRRLLCAFGAAATALAMLTSQAAASAGLMVWLITLALRSVSGEALRPPLAAEGKWLLGGFLAGGVLTKIIASSYHSPRAGWLHSPADKVADWLRLNETFFFWPRFYPESLDLLHASLLLLAVTVPSAILFRSRPSVLLTLGALYVAASVVPYVANLAVALDNMSFRTFYLAPLGLTLLCAVLYALSTNSRLLRILVTTLIVAIDLHDMAVARADARDDVCLYQAELAVIGKLKEAAVEHRCNRVGVLPEVTTPNPFGLHHPWTDEHVCDFQFLYTQGPCIEMQSPLQVIWADGDGLVQLRHAIQAIPPRPGIQIWPLPHLLYLQMD